MTDVHASVIVDLAGNLPRQANTFGRSMNTFSRNGERSMGRLGRSMRAVDRGLGRLSNRYTGFITGAAVVGATKQVVDFDASITRLGTSALLSEEKVESIKQQILSVANLPDIRIDNDQMAESVNKLFELTGDVGFVEANMKNLGLAMQGFGSDATATAELVAQFWEKGVRAPGDVEATLDRLFGQFAQAKVPVGDIARIAPQLFSVIQNEGPAAINQMAALLQVFAKTAGGAELAVTSLRGTFAVFDDPQKLKAINTALDNAGLAPAKNAEGKLRDVHQLLLDIAKVSNNDTEVLAGVFERESLFGFKALLKPENKVLLVKLVEEATRLGLTQEASAKNAATAASGLVALSDAAEKVANIKLSKPIQDLADHVNSLSSEEIEAFFDKAITGAKVLGAVLVGRKLLQLGGSLTRGLRAGGKGGLAGGLSAAGATPVFVINMPGGGLLPGAAVGNAASKLKGAPWWKGVPHISKLALLGAGTAAAGATAAGAAGYYGGGRIVNNAFASADKNFGTNIADDIGAALTKALAAVGNDNAQEVLRLNKAASEITIKVEGPGRVTKMTADAGTEITAEHSLGPSMVQP